MAKHAVIYVFNPQTEADEHLGAAMIVKKSKELFAGQEGLKIFACKDKAADTISYFLSTGELPNDVMTPSEDPDYVDIGASCFMKGDVINYLGENFYKACSSFVAELEGGGQSSCVKRIGHPGIIHEDFEGRTREGRIEVTRGEEAL